MAKRKVFRWEVVALFADGTRTVLRDFGSYDEARRWLETNSGRELYPGRVYRLEIESFEVTD